MEPLEWLVAAAGAGLVLAASVLLRRYRRRERLRQRRRRVLDELDELEIEEMDLYLDARAEEALPTKVARRQGGVVRRGQGFFLAPEREPADGGSPAAGQPLIVRFTRSAVRHELRCRFAGTARLARGGRRRLGVETRRLYRLVPAGPIVKRERRDMMRFYVGDGTSRIEGGTDARRFVDLRAWLRATDLDVGEDALLPLRLPADRVHVEGDPPPGAASSEPATPPDHQNWHVPQQAGCEAEVLDFSGSGLRVEADVEVVGRLAHRGAEESFDEALDRLDERALLVTLAVKLDFPPSVKHLEPPVPPWTWMLADVARVLVVENDEEEPERIRLGLELLYRTLDEDPVTGGPRRWQRLKGHQEADELVAIHNALNQAAAQMESTPATH